MIPKWGEEKTPQQTKLHKKRDFLNQITILDLTLQSRLTAQIRTMSVWRPADSTTSQPSDTSLSGLLPSFALFDIFHPCKAITEFWISEKNTKHMYCGWEWNPRQTKRVVAKMTELKRYIKTATICVLFPPYRWLEQQYLCSKIGGRVVIWQSTSWGEVATLLFH